MGVETPVTFGGLIIAIIFITAINLAPRLWDIIKLRTETKERDKEAARLEKEKATQAEAEKDEKVWDRVVTEYERQTERGNRLERELEQLRPLAIVNAVLEQKYQQSKYDKEDWKAHAIGLEEQLKENNIIPRPFRRIQHEGDTQEKLKTISRKMSAIQMGNKGNGDKEPSKGSPTLIFPPVERGQEE